MNDSTPKIDPEDRRVPCMVYSRIVGYYTPVGSWNAGKQQEFADRRTFDAAALDGDAQSPEGQ